MTDKVRATNIGTPATDECNCGAPTCEKYADGQYKDHWVLSESERSKGFVRPIRLKYRHVGTRPVYPLADLTDKQKEWFGHKEYVKYERYPEGSAALGRYWTEKDLNSGCRTVTTMGIAIAETYARNPGFYGSTFCVYCGDYFRVGADGEFEWDDGTKVGT